MTDRHRLRNQFTTGLVVGILILVKAFWTPWGSAIAPEAVWAGRVVAVGAACMCLWLAGTKYLEYREKYPRKPEWREETEEEGFEPPPSPSRKA